MPTSENRIDNINYQKRGPTQIENHHNRKQCARYFNLFHIYCSTSGFISLQVSVVVANKLVYSEVAKNNEACRKTNINRYHYCSERTTIDFKIAKELGGMKDHSVSAQKIRQ